MINLVVAIAFIAPGVVFCFADGTEPAWTRLVGDCRHADPEADKAKSIIVNKRSMASGYAGLDNDLFYQPNTMMVFGDATKVIEAMVKAVD